MPSVADIVENDVRTIPFESAVPDIILISLNEPSDNEDLVLLL